MSLFIILALIIIIIFFFPIPMGTLVITPNFKWGLSFWFPFHLSFKQVSTSFISIFWFPFPFPISKHTLRRYIIKIWILIMLLHITCYCGLAISILLLRSQYCWLVLQDLFGIIDTSFTWEIYFITKKWLAFELSVLYWICNFLPTFCIIFCIQNIINLCKEWIFFIAVSLVNLFCVISYIMLPAGMTFTDCWGF